MTLDWKIGGLALGFVFFMAMLLVKPIGVSTQFVILDGVIADAVASGTIYESAEGAPTSDNAYFAKYAKNIANPLNYSFIFVLAMALGAFLSSYLRKGVQGAERSIPALWQANFGGSVAKRFAVAFLGGFIVIFAARLAGGCTSGHMMSGMSQTAISGFLFAAGAFATAVPTALWLYKTEE